jgi:hypothetical protein
MYHTVAIYLYQKSRLPFGRDVSTRPIQSRVHSYQAICLLQRGRHPHQQIEQYPESIEASSRRTISKWWQSFKWLHIASCELKLLWSFKVVSQPKQYHKCPCESAHPTAPGRLMSLVWCWRTCSMASSKSSKISAQLEQLSLGHILQTHIVGMNV